MVHLKRHFLLAASLSFFALGANAVDVTGAGASFPAPIYAKWADSYHKATGVKINYQSIGSSGGVRQIQAKTVDFGASDSPLKPEDLAKSGLVQFPTVIGGVVPVINVKGIPGGVLKLSGKVLGDIYLGKVTKWNDAAIVALNPGLTLPEQDINVIRRADGAGTSFIFTNYLSKVNPEWKETVGQGSSVQWPVGLGGKGNEGVAASVQRLPGAIGYVEYVYVKQAKMKAVQMQNKEGVFVAPSDAGFKAAAASADWTKSAFYEILTDQPGQASWPITGATFILLHKTQEKPEIGTEVMKFFEWALKEGAPQADELDYAPLPEATVKLVLKSWSEIKDAQGVSLYKK